MDYLASNTTIVRRAALAAVFILAGSIASPASEWVGGVGDWSSDGNPGWNGSGVPNGQGAVAQWITPQAEFPDTYQNIGGGVTVGAINYGNSNDMGDVYWLIRTENGITLDQDGAGGGFATISNTSTNISASNALWIHQDPNVGNPLTLADDLHVISTATNSQNANGAIQIDSTLAGSGNITFNSTGPISSTATSSPGAIWLTRSNTFTGNVLVEQGLLIVNNTQGVDPGSFTPLGDAANVVTIGQSGSGSAALLARLNNAPLGSNSIVIAPGLPGETRTFGAASNGNFTVSSGSVTLNGDLNLRSGTVSLSAMQSYTGNFSGTGNLTKVGSAVAVFTGANTNSGTTTVSAGTLVFATPESLYNNQQGALAGYWDPSKITVEPGAALGFNIGNVGEFTELQVVAFNAMGNGSGGYKAGSSLALNPTVANYTYSSVVTNTNGGTDALGLTKVGANTLVLTANNTYTGGTNINGGALSLGSLGAINSVGAISFGGGALQHTAVNTTDYSSRFSNADNQAYSIDTNGENIAYASNLSSSGGSMRKAGSGILTLSGANSYTGTTTVVAGTLGVTGSHTGGTYIVAQNANLALDAGAAISSTGAFYVGPNSQGSAENMGSLTVNGIAGVNGYAYDTSENWGLGVGVFPGGVGVFTNSGSGTVNSLSDIRVGDGFGGVANGDFFQDSTGTVTASSILVGNAVGTGNFSKEIDSGDVRADYRAYIGTYGGLGTFTQKSGNVTVGLAGQEDFILYQEFYLGLAAGSHGVYDLQSGTLTVNGWSNLGRDGGTAEFNNAGTFATTRELRIGYTGGSEGTLNNSGSGVITAGGIFIGVGDATGHLNLGTVGEAWSGTVTTTGNFEVGDNGVGTLYQNGGEVICGFDSVIGYDGNGKYTLDAGTFSTANRMYVGITANGVGLIEQNGGTISNNWESTHFGWADGSSGTLTQTDGAFNNAWYVSFGTFAGSLGTFNKSGGSFSTPADLNIGDAGTGVLNMTGGDIDAGQFILAWNPGSSGTATMDGGTIDSTGWTIIGLQGTADFTLNDGAMTANVGNGGGAFGVGVWAGSLATFTQNGGSVTVNNDWFVVGVDGSGTAKLFNDATINSAVFALGQNVDSMGTFTQDTGPTGSVTVADWTYIGLNGSGTYNMDGGTFSAGDNFSIGLGAGGVGVMKQTDGTVTVVGNDPAYTGNFLVARNGKGTLEMSGGEINMIVGNTGTNNSASFSVAANPLPANPLASARDGNFAVGEQTGDGTVDLSGGTINVAANVFVGGADFTDPFDPLGGKGSLTIRNTGIMNVGETSPTGGDVVLGGASDSIGTINLQGGELNVDEGSGMIGAAKHPLEAQGTLAFNFTGGTLRVKEYNTSVFGGDLGNLVQNGGGSLLDVQTNSTTIHSSYDLGAGTATVGSGQTLTIDQGMINSAGTGVVNVNTGGNMLSNNLRTDTANVGGTITVRADGGAVGASKVETLSVTGGKLNLKNNDLVVGTGTVAAVRTQIKTGLSGVSNTAAAAGITSDMMTLGTHGFGYALGNDPNLSPLLFTVDPPGTDTGLLSGQGFDADSVLVKFTYRGDADLDGDSDLDDLGFWANSFTGDLGLGPVAAPTTLWTQGDWDYDGDTDLDDLGFWSSTFTGDLGGGGLSVYAPDASEGAIAALASMGITAVPEPGSVALLAIAFGTLSLARLRRASSRHVYYYDAKVANECICLSPTSRQRASLSWSFLL